jgi:hypothetical protein
MVIVLEYVPDFFSDNDFFELIEGVEEFIVIYFLLLALFTFGIKDIF